jgi:hypothetical protein
MENRDRAEDSEEGATQTSGLTHPNTTEENQQSKPKEVPMKWTVAADREFPNDWRVEAIEEDSGDIFVAVFSGPDAEERAREYSVWQQLKSRQHQAA